jgi:hypothetical protein
LNIERKSGMGPKMLDRRDATGNFVGPGGVTGSGSYSALDVERSTFFTSE